MREQQLSQVITKASASAGSQQNGASMTQNGHDIPVRNMLVIHARIGTDRWSQRQAPSSLPITTMRRSALNQHPHPCVFSPFRLVPCETQAVTGHSTDKHICWRSAEWRFCEAERTRHSRECGELASVETITPCHAVCLLERKGLTIHNKSALSQQPEHEADHPELAAPSTQAERAEHDVRPNTVVSATIIADRN